IAGPDLQVAGTIGLKHNLLPSGEYWGANSVRVDGIKLVGILVALVLLALLLESGMATRQIFKGPLELATYARRRPCLEIVGKEPPLPGMGGVWRTSPIQAG